MKKLLALLLSTMLILPALVLADSSEAADSTAPLSSTSDKAAPTSAQMDAMDAELTQNATELIQDMIALCSTEGYAQIYSGSSDMAYEINSALDMDYSIPERILVAHMNGEDFAAALGAIGGDQFNISEAQMRLMRKKTYAILPVQLNAQQGSQWLAATSIISASDIAFFDTVSDEIAYAIFDYGEESPLTYAAFDVDASGAACASAGLLKLEGEARAALFNESGIDWGKLLYTQLDATIANNISYSIYQVDPVE